MHLSHKLVGGLVFSAAGLIASCKTAGHSGVKDVVPVDAEQRIPAVGAGYDSLTQLALDTPSCITGTKEPVPAAKSEITLNQQADTAKVMREFTGEVRGTPRVFFAASGGFFRSLNTTDSSLTVTYAAKIVQGGEHISNVVLNPDVKALTPSQILEKCGDQYVSQVNKGGMLTISLNFDFNSKEARTKWQGLLSVNGPWGELSKDIKRRMEDVDVDGTLTIRVSQIGGSPNEALQGVKTCSLTNAADFAVCDKQMQDLFTYASNTFPAQVASIPGALNYVTMPLKNLGVRDLPELGADIIKIRKDLEHFAQDAGALSEQAAIAQAKGVPLDTAVARSISDNQSLIKQVADACFIYKVTDTGIDWSGCKTQAAALQAGLHPVSLAAVTVHQVAVAANQPNGFSVINRFGTPISVVYAVDTTGKWGYGTAAEVGYDGLNGGKGEFANDSVLPAQPKGRLLVRQTRNEVTAASERGTMTVGAGEGVAFFMNDQRGKYQDNVGSQVVYWRCTDCQDGTKERSTTRLLVAANSSTGVTFTNRGTKSAHYSVFSYGEWRNAGNRAWSGGDGRDAKCGRGCPLPNNNDQALILITPDGEANFFTNDNDVTLAAQATMTFIDNEQPGGYKDNSGELELLLQCTDCTP